MHHARICRFLVTGASSPFGRRVVEMLLRSADVSVTATSRAPEQLVDLAARGAQVRMADYDDPASLDVAFAGVERLLLSHGGMTDMPGLRPGHIHAVVQAVVRAQVRQIVCTSIAAADSRSSFVQEQLAAERAMETAGIRVTTLRLAPFVESLFDRIALALRSGRWPTSAGAGRVAYVTRDDAARAATAALSERATESRCLDVTGCEALTHAEVVAVCNAVFGASIELVPMDDESLAAAFAGAGMEMTKVEQILNMERHARAGLVDAPSVAVERLTGRVPLGLRDVLIKHRLDLLLASKKT